MRIVAIIAVRNSAAYVKNCLNHLLANGIEVAVLDQDSDDGTYELCHQFKGNGLCHLARYDYPGYFSLRDQLIEKQKLISRLKTDWVIHQDMDECLECTDPQTTLSKAISETGNKGYNAINFNEFLFIPYVSEGESFYRSRYYYFFENRFPRLIRAWKKSANLSNIELGGHGLSGNFNLSPVSYNLRHYMFTSQSHAFEKYPNRLYSDDEVQQYGWHRHRLNISREKLIFPARERLEKLIEPDSRQFNTSQPHDCHYWEW